MSFSVEYENSYTVNVHKVKINLDINTTNCEDHSANCSTSCKLFRILPISIPLKDSEIKGDVFIHKGIRDWASRHRKPNELNFELILYNVKRFEVDAKLNFSSLSPPLNTTILRSGEMSKPISWSMPIEKVCQKLYKKDEQICDLKYGESMVNVKILQHILRFPV